MIASQPAAASVLQWWSEFSVHLLQTESGPSGLSCPDIPTEADDSLVLDALIHYLRAVHLVDFYTGKTGSSVLDLCRTVGARPPCRQPPLEQQPDSTAVMSKAKSLLHIHRQHLNALAASRTFSQTPDNEGATLVNFLQDWERLYPEVCVRALPPPPTAGRGVAVGQTFPVHSPQAHAAYMSHNSNTPGRSPRKLPPFLQFCSCRLQFAFRAHALAETVISEPLDQSRVVATYVDLVFSSADPEIARNRPVLDMCTPSY
jgi:hypothetical protein